MSTAEHPVGLSAGGVYAARRLHKAAVRRVEGRFLVEGPQAVREAAAAGRLLAVFATAEAADKHLEQLRDVPVSVVGDRALAGLAETATPQGLVGVAATVAQAVDGALGALGTCPRLVAVLVDARDPGNAGTVIRVADAAGADAVLFAHTPGGGSVDVHNGKCVRASTGSVFHVSIGVGPLDETLDALRARGLQLLAADGAATPYLDLDAADDALVALADPSAILFGNEARGLPPAVLAAADRVIRVPLHGRAESLNLAAAAAVCLYACARQQRRVRREPRDVKSAGVPR